MSILRILIRFLIIAIAIGLLVFLSISLFRLIPAGINQLASATVSLGQPKPITVATTTDSQKDATPAPVTEDGLNGVYDTKGNIVILEGTQARATSTVEKTAYYPTTRTGASQSYTTSGSYYARTYIPTRTLTGAKNLKVTFSSIGILQNGRFIQTNTFNTYDTVSMRFTVLNEEDTPTGPWAMRVEMPASAGADKVKVLTNLNSIPGESSYTGEVRFDGIDLSQGTPVIRIYLDIYNQVAEANESDNTLAIELRNVNNTYSNNNSYNNCFNGTYYYNCNTTYTDTLYSNNQCWNGSYYYNCNTNTSSNNNCWNGSYYYNCDSGNYGTQPNLTVTSLELGRYTNGTFYSQTTFNYGETVVVRARVRNNGGSFSGSWLTRLNVYDANNYSRDITNGSVQSLSPNTETTVVYEVTNLTRGSNRLTFYLDTSNNIAESNEGDNSSQITIQVY